MHDDALGSRKSRGSPLDSCVASAAHALIALLRIGKNVRGRKVRSSRVERWRGRILDAELYRLSELVASHFSEHRKREVDARCDAAAGEPIAVDADAFVAGLSAKLVEGLPGTPVHRSTVASQQSSGP